MYRLRRHTRLNRLDITVAWVLVIVEDGVVLILNRSRSICVLVVAAPQLLFV